MKEVPETTASESIEYPSRISIFIGRHEEKDSESSLHDDDIPLTPSGRKAAMEASDTYDLQQSLAYGGTRKRTGETAARRMIGEGMDVTGDETYNELLKKLDGNRKYGSRVGKDTRLDFVLDEDNPTEYGREVLQALEEGGFQEWLIEHSDELAQRLGNKEEITYSRAAGAIAQIMKRYYDASNRWNQLVNDSEYGPTLERTLGTQQNLSESFLAKVIDKTRGSEERKLFIDSINGDRFEFGEGYEVEIVHNNSGEHKVHITYEKTDGDEIIFSFDETVPVSVIDEIVEEGK